MTTTTRRAKRPATTKSKPANARDETLEQFDAMLSAQTGEPVGFADVVRDLWVTRQRLANLKAARSDIFAQVRAAYDGGARVAGGYELRQTARREPEVYRAVDSATVKKRAPAAYAAAKTLVRRVSVTAPTGSAGLVPRDRTPKLRPTATADQAVAAYKSDLFALIKLLGDEETELIGRLDKIAANFGWDGDEIAFADGWKAATRRLQFSADRLREIDPETWEALAVTKVREIAPRVYLAKPGDDADGAVDLDSE